MTQNTVETIASCWIVFYFPIRVGTQRPEDNPNGKPIELEEKLHHHYYHYRPVNHTGVLHADNNKIRVFFFQIMVAHPRGKRERQNGGGDLDRHGSQLIESFKMIGDDRPGTTTLKKFDMNDSGD